MNKRGASRNELAGKFSSLTYFQLSAFQVFQIARKNMKFDSNGVKIPNFF